MIEPSAAWWTDRAVVRRFVCDLLAGELGRLRPGRSAPALPWTDRMRLDEDGIGADSLERLQLGTALAEAVHLERGGVDDALLAMPTVGDWVETVASGLERFSAELTFATSGSTGQPKWCVHRLADLWAEIDILAERFAGCRRVLTAVPSHHIYGFLFTILLPVRLGVPVVDVRANVPGLAATRLEPGDVLIAHPEFWRAFVRAALKVAPGVRGVSSTAPCPADIARGVTASGIETLVEVYGSSETAGIGWRVDPADAYELFPYWQRGQSDDELSRQRRDGSSVTMRAPDRLRWAGARHITPVGRLEGAVQVGGHNVFPERIVEILRSHPGVRAAAVRLMRPEEGQRLKAFVVPMHLQADDGVLRSDLWTWIDSRLSSPERPKSIVFGPALPVGALGKSADWQISGTESQADDEVAGG